MGTKRDNKNGNEKSMKINFNLYILPPEGMTTMFKSEIHIISENHRMRCNFDIINQKPI